MHSFFGTAPGGRFAVFFGLVLLSLAGFALGGLPALVAAFAFGFIVPGFLLLKAFKFEGSVVETVALSILGSVLVSSHAVYWSSIALGGYSSFSIFAAFAAISGIALLCDFGKKERQLRLAKADWKEELPAIAFSLAVFAVLFSVFAQTLWVPTETGVRVGGWNWSDLFAHLPIIESVNRGNFPPQTPFFAGAPLVYHWFVDLHSAFLSKSTGIAAAEFIRFENALYSALLVLSVFSLAKIFLKNRNAALVAAALVLFGGSFAYVNFFSDAASGGNAAELVKSTPYDNDWKFFQVPSVLGGYMLVQRPQMAGLPGLVAVVFLAALAFAPSKLEKKKFLLAGIFAGLLAPFQFYAYASALLVAALFFLATLSNGGLSFADFRKNFEKLVAPGLRFAVPAILLAAPFVVAAVSTTTSAGNAKIALGWLALEQGKLDALRAILPQGLNALAQPVEFAVFYAANLGMPVLLAVAALFSVKFKGKKTLALWMLSMFLVANVFSFSGTLWDMAKFFAFLAVPAGILAAAFLEKIWENGAIGKAGAGALLIASVLTPVLILAWTWQSQWQGLSNAELEAGRWIDENTPQKSVFAAYFGHISPVDSVAGRLRLSGYSSWMANYGLPNYREREADIRTVFCGSAENAANAMQKYGATFVYFGREEKEKFSGCDFAFSQSDLFEKRFGGNGIEIYELQQ